jgi:hypothetical protein
MFSDRLVALGLACGLLGAAGAACAQSVAPDDPARRSTADYSQDAQSAATPVFIDRGQIESLPQLIDSLIDAITRLSSFRKPATMPRVTRVSRAEIERTICSGPCMVKAWYLPGEGIFFDESLTPETNLIHRSILLHELVHFVQEVNGDAAALDPCHRWVQREQQAYELQAQYLALIGDDSGSMQRVSMQSTLVGSRTVCRGFDQPANASAPPRQIFMETRPPAPRQ